MTPQPATRQGVNRQAPSRPRIGPPHAAAASVDPFKVLRRYLPLIIASVLIGVALGFVATEVFERVYPLYHDRVVFEIRPSLRETTDVLMEDNLQDDVVIRMANTELSLLMSREVLTAAMRNPEIRRTEWSNYRRLRDETTNEFSIDEAVDELIDDLSGYVPRDANLFGVGWSTHKPEDVPIVLGAIARAYIDKRRALDDNVYVENQAVFGKQLDDSTIAIRDLTTEIENFIRQRGITALDDPRFHQLSVAMDEIVSDITRFNSGLSLSRSQYQATSAKLEGKLEPSADDRREAERDPQMEFHMQRVINLETELRRLRDTYTDINHPQITSMASALRAAEDQRDKSLNEIMQRNLQARLSSLADQISSYEENIKRMEADYGEKDTRLRELAANYSTFQNMEDRRELLEKQRDADLELIKELRLMRARADASRVRVAQEARTPRHPAFPDWEYMVPLSAIAIPALTIGLIFLREMTDRRVKTAHDLAIMPGARPLGVIPELDEDPTRPGRAELVVARAPSSVLAESYRQAFMPLIKAMDVSGLQSVLMVGGLPGAGTTAAATNLAALLAAMGKSVIVIDGNFRRPRLAETLGASNDGTGLGDLLAGVASLDDAIVRTDAGIDFIGPGTPGSRVIERLSNGKFESVMAELRDRYDLIVVDSPPAVVAGDAMALAGKVDAAVLVIRALQEQRGLVARLINQLQDSHCELLGVLLNGARGTAGGYFRKNYRTMASYAAKK
jgi:capsular exopolysaccharide synthesis family protein